MAGGWGQATRGLEDMERNARSSLVKWEQRGRGGELCSFLWAMSCESQQATCEGFVAGPLGLWHRNWWQEDDVGHRRAAKTLEPPDGAPGVTAGVPVGTARWAGLTPRTGRRSRWWPAGQSHPHTVDERLGGHAGASRVTCEALPRGWVRAWARLPLRGFLSPSPSHPPGPFLCQSNLHTRAHAWIISF